jgi:putative zinc finger/helix-turn-helix YgiT family protein
MQCPCCMENHDVRKIRIEEQNTFKGMSVKYDAEYFYCDKADEMYADEEQISENDIKMKNSYRQEMDLLTSAQIIEIRMKYGISQSDLSLLL